MVFNRSQEPAPSSSHRCHVNGKPATGFGSQAEGTADAASHASLLAHLSVLSVEADTRWEPPRNLTYDTARWGPEMTASGCAAVRKEQAGGGVEGVAQVSAGVPQGWPGQASAFFRRLCRRLPCWHPALLAPRCCPLLPGLPPAALTCAAQVVQVDPVVGAAKGDRVAVGGRELDGADVGGGGDARHARRVAHAPQPHAAVVRATAVRCGGGLGGGGVRNGGCNTRWSRLPAVRQPERSQNPSTSTTTGLARAQHCVARPGSPRQAASAPGSMAFNTSKQAGTSTTRLALLDSHKHTHMHAAPT